MTDPNGQSDPHRARNHESAPEHERISPRKAVAAAVVLVVLALVLGIAGILPRVHADNELKRHTEEFAPPAVSARPAEMGDAVNEFILPGNVTAFTDAPIYARTSGYLSHWYFDIGSHVKKGALLAEIATPELDQQVMQAEADLATAQTNAGNAKTQADRYSGLVSSDAVSRQDTDTYVNQAASAASGVRSAEANLNRLRQMQSFEKVYAPFDGVVTARNVDTGQLITEGGAAELFHLQALSTLRIYTNVPEVYASTIHKGAKYGIAFPEMPGRTYQATVVRTTSAIDPASRTLLVELDLDNRRGDLYPGSLAQVHFETPAPVRTFVLPVAAVIFRKEGLQLAVLKPDNTAHLVHVTMGEDDGATVQIVSGITATDKIIQDPPDGLIDGEKVTPVTPKAESNKPDASKQDAK